MRRMLRAGLAALFLAVFLIAPQTAYARDELKNNDPDKYYILLDLKNQIVTVFERDENGHRVLYHLPCSTSKTGL